jgi:hypothetical protein
VIRVGAPPPRTDSRPPAALVVGSRSSRRYARLRVTSRPLSPGLPRLAGQRCSRGSRRIKLHRPSRCQRLASLTVPGQLRRRPLPHQRWEPCRQRQTCGLLASSSRWGSRVAGPPYRSGIRQPPLGRSGPGRSASASARSPMRPSSSRSLSGRKHPQAPRHRLSPDLSPRPRPVTVQAPERPQPSPVSGRSARFRSATPTTQTRMAHHRPIGVR